MTADQGPRKGGVIVTPNPYIWESWDYRGRSIRATISWVPVTRLIANIQVDRDALCLFTKIVVGMGPSGTPDDSPMVFNCPGTNILLDAAQLLYLASIGLPSIDAVLNNQVTALP